MSTIRELGSVVEDCHRVVEYMGHEKNENSDFKNNLTRDYIYSLISHYLLVEKESTLSEVYTKQVLKRNSLAKPSGLTRITLISIVVEYCLENTCDFLIAHLAASYFDRYYSNRGEAAFCEDPELIMVVCVFLAEKLNSRKFDKRFFMEGFKLFYSKSLNKKSIIANELKIMKALNYQMNIPTSFDFHGHLVELHKMQEPLRSVSLYILNVILVSVDYLHYKTASTRAAVSIYLARKILKYPILWEKELEFHTGITEESLKHHATTTLRMFARFTKMNTSLDLYFGRPRMYNALNVCRNFIVGWELRELEIEKATILAEHLMISNYQEETPKK